MSLVKNPRINYFQILESAISRRTRISGSFIVLPELRFCKVLRIRVISDTPQEVTFGRAPFAQVVKQALWSILTFSLCPAVRQRNHNHCIRIILMSNIVADTHGTHITVHIAPLGLIAHIGPFLLEIHLIVKNPVVDAPYRFRRVAVGKIIESGGIHVHALSRGKVGHTVISAIAFGMLKKRRRL